MLAVLIAASVIDFCLLFLKTFKTLSESREPKVFILVFKLLVSLVLSTAE